jgi:hypothetical protein
VSICIFLSWYRGLEFKGIFTCPQGDFPTTDGVLFFSFLSFLYFSYFINSSKVSS